MVFFLTDMGRVEAVALVVDFHKERAAQQAADNLHMAGRIGRAVQNGVRNRLADCNFDVGQVQPRKSRLLCQRLHPLTNRVSIFRVSGNFKLFAELVQPRPRW